MSRPHRTTWWGEAMRRRLDPDAALGLRFTLGFAGVLVLVVPFLLLWLLVEDRWAPLLHLDRGVAAAVNNAVYDHPAIVEAMRAISDVFGPSTFRVLGVAVALVLLWRGAPRLGAFVAVTILGGSLLGSTAKVLAGRDRPVLDHPVAHAPGLSFPSGHAVGSLVGVAVLLLVLLPVVPQRLRRTALVAGAVVVVLVGVSRVGLGVHYVSDVVGGWLLGGAWVVATTAAFTAWRRDTGKRPVRVTVEGVEPEASAPGDQPLP